MAQRLIVRNMQAPGDIIVLSAALRDLHIAHPGLYSPEIWVSPGAEQVYWHNPAIGKIHGKTAARQGAQFVSAGYSDCIKRSNQDRRHFLWGFIVDLNKKLSTKIKLTEFRPAIYMSDEEKATRPFKDPYWVFLSGGKKDFKTKIWDQVYWQQVINMTRDRVNWVQCGGGSSNHIMHEPKEGIYANMIAKTSCRDFLRLIYHAEGVVCVITMAMHAAAAFNKPCVVIAGGREPWWWEAYNAENRLTNMRLADPNWTPPADDDFVPHKFLHSIGQLDCCRNHGCWKKHVTGKRDSCRFPTNQHGSTIPRCKAEITPDMVVKAIDEYLDAGLARRASTGRIALPFSSMALPKDSAPSIPAAVVDAPIGVDVPPITYCLYGHMPDPPQVTAAAKKAGKILAFENGMSRSEAMRLALKEEHDWLVWIERGARFTQLAWLAALINKLQKPCVIGRAHRTERGGLYPYPAFFAVHRSLLQEAATFDGSFTASAESYVDADFVQLPTTIAEVS